MSIQTSIYAALSAIGTLGATKVHPNVLPQNPAYPCAAYQFITNMPSPGYIATARRSDFGVQVTIYSRTYADLPTLRLAVIAACEAMPECVERQIDLEAPYEFQTATYSWILQFRFMDTDQ
jgi:hypothetical protein